MLRSKRIDPISRLKVLLPDRVCGDLELDFTFATEACEVDYQNQKLGLGWWHGKELHVTR
jgi:hypothetical protein